MRAKPTSEYLDFAETFPTAIAESMGNGWTAETVLKAVKELRELAGKCEPNITTSVGFGALAPK